MDETRPIPARPERPRAGQEIPGRENSGNVAETGAGEKRPDSGAPGRREGGKAGMPADPSPSPAPESRKKVSFIPPPPPNWPDREGWKIGIHAVKRAASLPLDDRKPGSADGSRAESNESAEEKPSEAPSPAVPSPPEKDDEKRERSFLEDDIPLFPAPPPALFGPPLVETRPVPQSVLPRPLPEEASPLPTSRPSPRLVSKIASRRATRKSETPAPRNPVAPGGTRLQRALTYFVLGATILIGIGTVAAALSIYRPDLPALQFLQPFSISGGLDDRAEESSAFPQVSTPQATLFGEQSAVGTPAPIIIPPTPDCGEPSLTIGDTRFSIQMAGAEADGSIQAPLTDPGLAYWVEGTDTHLVFALSPTQENLNLLASLDSGETALVELASCNTNEFSLETFGETLPDSQALLDQSLSGISIVLQDGPGGLDFIASGGLAGQQFVVVEAPEFDPNEVEAEIGFLGKSVSLTGANITVRVSVYNYSPNEFSVTENDVALQLPGQEPQPPAESRPDLPKVVRPGMTEEFRFTFLNPGKGQGIFQIFTTEFDLSEY